jgi:predicted O-methyltransferase YrrM
MTRIHGRNEDVQFHEPMIPLRLIPPAHRRGGVITVAMPSRNRTVKMVASLRSLLDTAKRPDQIEILVAHDEDDQETAEVARALNVNMIWQSPYRYGYAGSAHYWAYLLNESTGEWLLPTWSDDAIMKTPGWDDMLRAQPAGSVAFLDGNYPGLTCFPAVHADALGAIGRLAPLPALDTWFEYAGRDAGVLVHPGIYVHQDRPDLTGCEPDQNHIEGGGAWRAGVGGTLQQAFYQPPYTTWRLEDTAALRTHRELEEGYAARLAVWSDIQEQAPILRDTARRYWKPTIIELGTRTGESTSAFLAGVSATGGHVYSMDIGPATNEWLHTDLWDFMSADDMSDAAAEWLPDECDILFIDTSHTYEHTLAELRRYVPRVRPGGTVLMHDPELRGDDPIMGWEWVHNAPDAPEFPVAAAIDTYCAETGLTWERQTERPAPAEGRPFYGLGTIMIPGGDE